MCVLRLLDGHSGTGIWAAIICKDHPQTSLVQTTYSINKQSQIQKKKANTTKGARVMMVRQNSQQKV
jgi:hypothetical protein